MKLTVDASIVAKWFLTEPQSEEARQLLAPRIRLHAPDLLLVEYANIVWKKVHRREISDPQPYLDELARLPEAVTLHRSADFLDHAARIAMEMDHPVYDCLYLACADATRSVLITADHRLAKKAAGSSVEVWTIGSAGVADRIEMAATAPIIRGEKIEELIKAARVCRADRDRCSASGVATNVRRSPGVTPKRKSSSRRLDPAAAGRPSVTPAATSSAPCLLWPSRWSPAGSRPGAARIDPLETLRRE